MTVDGSFLDVNPASADMFGYTVDDLMAVRNVTALLHPDDRFADVALRDAVLAGEIPSYSAERRCLHADGSELLVRYTLTAVFDDCGDPQALIGMVEDVTERHRFEARLAAQQSLLERQATEDSLTGLVNRVTLREQLDRRFERARAGGGSLAVMYLDLDRFKVVNDTLGHATGDELLRVIAGRLREVTRPTDLVARVSGDEFVIVLDGSTSADDARRIAQRVVEVLDQPVRVGSRQTFTTASVGLAFGGPDVPDATTLLANADVAMYAAKDLGRNRVVEFDATMRARVIARHETDLALRTALEREQLVLHHQPVLEIENRLITAVETLLRWRRPGAGLVGPDEFVPVAEENGLIVPIGTWVVDEACRQIAAWRQQDLRMRVAVNVSARQLQTGDLVTVVGSALDRYRIPPDLLTIEIAEGTLVDDVDQATGVLEDLRSLGVDIALDDFGTGFSSLTYLCRLPIDVVKVDRAFTAQLVDDPRSRAVVRMLAAMAEESGWRLVAEGVETDAQLEAVSALGCGYAQGYLISPPVEAAQVPAVVSLWGLSGDGSRWRAS